MVKLRVGDRAGDRDRVRDRVRVNAHLVLLADPMRARHRLD